MAASERRRDVWCAALLAAVATVFLIDVLVAGTNFFYRDLLIYNQPIRRIVRDALISGEFPFWSRALSAGQPLAANPAYALFYPPQLLILAGSFHFGFAMYIVFHIYAALIGMFVLLRQLALGRPAAVFGAFAFGLGGLLLGCVPTLAVFLAWAVAPWVAWGVVRFLQQPSASRFAVAALLGGMHVFTGEPMSLAQVWLLILAGAIFAGRRSPSWRAGAQVVAIGAAAAVIAAVQLVPAIDHVGDSARARGLSYHVVRQFALPVLRPVEIVIPHALGIPNPYAGAFWGRELFDRQSPYLGSLYAGIFVPIFALAGFLLRLPGARTTLGLALLSYVLALGDRTPLLRLLYDAGLLRGFRYPEKFAAFGVVALIVFAAFASDRFMSGDRRVWRATAIAGAIVLAIAAAPVVWTLLPNYAESFMRVWQLAPDRADLPIVARWSWLVGFVITAAAATIVLAARRGVGRKLLLASSLVLAIDLLLYGNQILIRLPSEFFDPPAITADLAGDPREFAIFHRGEWLPDDPNRKRFLAGSAIWTIRNALPPLTAPLWGYRSVLELDFDETALLPTHDLLNTMMALGNSGFARWAEPFGTMSNVRYVLDYRDFQQDRIESGGNPFRSKPVRVTRVREQPRYFFANALHRVNSRDEALAFFRMTPQPYGAALVPFEPAPVGAGQVLRVAETSNTADIDVDASGRAFLVATVTRHKYWQARIDGHPARLVPVNIAYQGLYVPPGVHRVEMRYNNPLVVWSGLASILAVGVAAAMILKRPRNRQIPREDAGSLEAPR